MNDVTPEYTDEDFRDPGAPTAKESGQRAGAELRAAIRLATDA
jgi:hypothetical protein